MDLASLRSSPMGELVSISGTDPRSGMHYEHFAFVPGPLPDHVELAGKTWHMAAQAMEAAGRLKQACLQLPSPQILIVPALTLEAVSTSALEGTYAALPDVLEARLPRSEPRSAEVREVIGYEDMAEQAFEWVRERPVTIGMLTDMQGVLARSSRKPPRDPGRVREHQVIIGPEGCSVYDARFIPPPPGDALVAGLESWQRWINEERDMPVVLRAAMAHYQFETLHPFGDGNGRIGRLVIVLQLLREGTLPAPALTISPWLLRRKEEYSDHLLRLSQTGEWDPWLQFFSLAVKEQCESHVDAAQRLLEWIARVRHAIGERRWGGVILRIAEDMVAWPVITMSSASEKYGVSLPSAKSAIDRLIELGALAELTGGKYRRVFGATEVMRIVESL